MTGSSSAPTYSSSRSPHPTNSVDDRITLILSVSIKICSTGWYCCIFIQPLSSGSYLTPPPPFQWLPLLASRFSILSFMKSKVSSRDVAAAPRENEPYRSRCHRRKDNGGGVSSLLPARHPSQRDIWATSCVSSVRSVVCEKGQWHNIRQSSGNGDGRLVRTERAAFRGGCVDGLSRSRLAFSISKANRGSRRPQTWHVNIAPVIAHLSVSDF